MASRNAPAAKRKPADARAKKCALERAAERC